METSLKRPLVLGNSIRQALVILLLITSLFSLAQHHDWKKVTWRDKDIQNNPGLIQQKSGDEWWYSHKNLIVGGKHVGYIAVGYLADLVKHGDEQKIINAFNEGPDSPFNKYPNSANFFVTPTFTTVFGSEADKDCRDFYDVMAVTNTVNAAEERTEFRGMLARLDLQGNMLWCRLATTDGAGLQEVYVDGTDIYVIGRHQGAMTMALNSVTNSVTVVNKEFLGYNPTSQQTATNNVFDVSIHTTIPTNTATGHMYVGKYDIDGHKQWAFLYGTQDFTASPADAWTAESIGEDLLVHSNGTLYAVGRAATSGTSQANNLFVAQITPSTGYLQNYSVYPIPTTTNFLGNSVKLVEGRAVCEYTNGNLVIGCTAEFNTGTLSAAFIQGMVYSINQTSLTINPSWTPNPIIFPQANGVSSTYSNSAIWDILCHSLTQEILVPLINNCDGCNASGDNHAYGQIFRLEGTTGTLSASGATNPVNFGAINAFDLRFGVTETSDGGFAAVSARANYTVFDNPSMGSLGSFSTCPQLTTATTPTTSFEFWDTDPVIKKFDQLANYEWEWSEDVSPGRARSLPPNGDFKRNECMYHITEAWDEGLVISGNCSFNHDDNYMVKLYSPCSGNFTYSIPSGTTINASTTWSTSRSIKGVVTITSGNMLTINGNAVIKFADSKSTGVRTYIQIQPGATLNVTGGATLTSMDNTVCPNSMWDGVVVVGTASVNQTGTLNLQGVLQMDNGTIMNARNGVTTGDEFAGSPGSFNWATTGGIINAKNSYFINNNRDVQYMAYLAPNQHFNLGSFYNCHFLTTDELNDRTDPTGHISMFAVNGVRIRGCEFAYTAGTAYAPNKRGYGIFGYDANFRVEDLCSNLACSSYTQSTFKDLSPGIQFISFQHSGIRSLEFT